MINDDQPPLGRTFEQPDTTHPAIKVDPDRPQVIADAAWRHLVNRHDLAQAVGGNLDQTDTAAEHLATRTPSGSAARRGTR